MKNILLVSSSQPLEDSHPREASQVLARLLRVNSPGAEIAVRDLATDPLPVGDEVDVAARTLKAHQRTVSQQGAIDLSDALARELAAADVVIIAAATSDSASSELNAWFDYVIRSGIRFGDFEKWHQGRLTTKRIYLVQARNGIEAAGQMHLQQLHMTAMLAGIGLTNVHTIEIEGGPAEKSAAAFEDLPRHGLVTD